MKPKKTNVAFWAKSLFIIVCITIWQVLFLKKIWPEILFPSPLNVMKAVVLAFSERGFGMMISHSLRLLIEGVLLGIIFAILFSGIAMLNVVNYSIYNMIVTMFDLIPGIALIPIVILWFGIGDEAIIFMVIHSVIWPLSRSVLDGFKSVSQMYIEVGRNIGLNRYQMVTGVYFPAALPRLFSGIKVGWARAWRGLISAEMVFGGGTALGLGYYITDRRTNLDIAGIFAAIIVIIAIGAVMEYGIFKYIENHTIKKWGMIR